ncbi:myosin heavy chain, putative [Entamoeba histolytica HM-1:IMSS-B]|uniref:Myosin heavy chain, putative n=6 Tax=Entamoeba histolytica TaxID=5759 RepID=B1N3E5_ENTH1|nr:myosin heavy chain, putative [Entamoeba histolytica HM-1:IMSS]EMD48475.1 myosin heavy chain, putative [Entamoeba histolytica KU27]EMH72688.1 myosin heavy chain, putative [Entamoeba histolytica HM-1:IMSS-B]EMS12762.1 myosin heavy chain, putative [Entamoeba histolytica HM-3:IMSS]ENY63850.1 myosin heavy chain, putative [Entamoeba histolytica HM-1:IMSS-A]GAT95270.1 myosin heavy chain putative [Entamoeba histolytica]|eukprot:XP_001913711.1 myosin heavy chain, putative [Entamoeba histolytica HM-1:IMSS]
MKLITFTKKKENSNKQNKETRMSGGKEQEMTERKEDKSTEKGNDPETEMKEYEKVFDSIVKDNERQRKQRTFRCQSMIVSQQEIDSINQQIDRELAKEFLQEINEPLKSLKGKPQGRNELKFNIETQIKKLTQKRVNLMKEVHSIDCELERLKRSLELLQSPIKDKKPKKKEKRTKKEEDNGDQKGSKISHKTNISTHPLFEVDSTTNRLKLEKQQFENEREVIINERERLDKELRLLEDELKIKQDEFEKTLKEATDRYTEQGKKKKKEKKKKKIEEERKKVDLRLSQIENEIIERQKLLEERLKVLQHKQDKKERKFVGKSLDMRGIVN